ncbi:MAG: helix-hairpin-helix domain-containing protein [Planctomycetota bacterium]|nr:helix-hairpin-helix domain-containing protein [Planctomycetota bacterium]
MQRTSVRAIASFALILICLCSLPAFASTAHAAAADRAGTAPAEKVDLNRASAAQLESVPGIGPSLAQRIVDFRKEHGPFRRMDDLLKVRGIGEKSLAKITPYLVVKS